MNAAVTRLWIRVSANRRKFGLLCGAVGFGLLLWARIIILSNLPKTAIALPPEPADAPPQVREPSGEPIPITLAVVTRRDPFDIAEAAFPSYPPDDTDASDIQKSPADSSEDLERTRLERVLQGLVARVRLEAVLLGQPRTAVIDGQTYREGEFIMLGQAEVVAFRVENIRERVVTLEAHGYTFEVRIPAPRSN